MDQSTTESPRFDNTYLYVLALDRHAHHITIDWIIELLKRNGLQLVKLGEQTRIDHRICKNIRTEEILLAVSAPVRSLLNAAKEIQLTSLRPDKVSPPKPVSSLLSESLFEEEISPPNTPNSFLTRSERQRCLLHLLENIQSDQPGKDVLLGYPSVFVYPGQAIIPICHREKIITRYFPLHCKEELENLEKQWLWTYGQPQPINSIRSYFGESVAFYFAFMEFYTVSLIVPVVLGLIQFLFFSEKFDSLFAMLSIIYLTVFIKMWKRKSSEYAYQWGSLKSPITQRPRSMFRAKLLQDKRGRLHLTYPIQRTLAKVYFISLPLVIFCLFGSIKTMLICLDLERMVAEPLKHNSDYKSYLISMLPGVVYAILVWLMNRFYQILAEKLTEFENHRTQSSHDAHLIVKLALFEFINNFGSVFYVAFYVQDIQQVRWQIGSLLVIGQFIDNFIEVLVPWLTYYINIELPLQRRLSSYKILDVNRADSPNANNPSIQQRAYVENHMPEYEGTYNDHLEIFIQIGYVYLFASVFPLAGLCAIINNMIEIKSDAFKMCRVFQRPNARLAKGINPAWMKAFEVIGLMSVTTFCAHIGISSFMQDFKVQFKLDQTQYVLLIVLIEHITLSIILVIYYVVPDQPKHIREKFQLLYGFSNTKSL